MTTETAVVETNTDAGFSNDFMNQITPGHVIAGLAIVVLGIGLFKISSNIPKKNILNIVEIQPKQIFHALLAADMTDNELKEEIQTWFNQLKEEKQKQFCERISFIQRVTGKNVAKIIEAERREENKPVDLSKASYSEKPKLNVPRNLKVI